MLDDTDARATEMNEGSEAAKRASPDRSTVAFPYTHLEDAISIARTIADNGTALSRDQIAAVMGMSLLSGGFSLKVGAARTFRLIEAVDGKNQLTDLGARILSVDENEAKQARRDAFMNVELYVKALEAFKNRPLPPRPHGLEAAFVQFGVAPKQKDKARLAFERSAQYAGFFHAGKDRLVEPIINQSFAAGLAAGRQRNDDGPPPPTPPVQETKIIEVWSEATREPLVKGLLDRLPHPGEDWNLVDRARWLRALAVNLSMVYGPDDDGEIDIKAPVKQKPSAWDAPAPKPAPPAPPAKRVEPEPSRPMDMDDEIPF